MTVRRWAPPLAWAVFILILTSLPGAMIAGIRAPVGADKLVHFTLYGVLGLLAAWPALAARRWARAALIVLLLISAFGALDEFHQRFIAGRSSDVHDWIADTLGAAVGIMAAVRARRREPAA
ncbi:MAG TPA: VanZ family protein [Gemmatimonadaceae bacterium]|nr:VanZ family protein [Gemmatimonadaceae bacterium]